MKAFLLSMCALAAIGIGTWLVLSHLGWDAADVYSSGNVRLGTDQKG
jgi:hypothetical protein